jgi:group I intron endonuclease
MQAHRSSDVLCWIYLIRNIVNEKVYVGQTWRPIHKRWDNGRGYKGNYHFAKAIEKYGVGAFEHIILTVANTQEMANYWEDHFTSLYDARNKDKGYNIKEAGANGKHSMESRKKMSNSRDGAKVWRTSRNTPRRQQMHRTIIEMYVAGATYPQIMETAGCGENTITRVIKKAGIPLRSTIKAPDPREKIACDMYASGIEYAEIMRATGYSRSGIRKIVVRNGYDLRKPWKLLKPQSSQ